MLSNTVSLNELAALRPSRKCTIIGATNANLKQMAEEGLFRWDLLDRLSFDVVHMPPLRVREKDIDLLAEHFAIRFAAESGWHHFPGFSDQVRSHCMTMNGQEIFANSRMLLSVRCIGKARMAHRFNR